MERSSKAPDARHQRGVLTRLRTDASGNTLAMMAMATIPLAGMVGSAVDIGRSYLIKSRLQQACDAGVLAARRSMAGSTLDTNSSQLGSKFFNTNFATGTAGATNIAFNPSATAEGQVQATAAARVPMTITKIFGTEYIDLSVQCEAKLEISNTDVMMVLDVTGSMACQPDDSNCNSGPSSKIVALRSAVVNFYDTINNATSSDARFRIGFVPYSAAVNMGTDPFTNTPLLPSSWMVDNWTYQSRVANMTTPGWTGTTTFGGWTNETLGWSVSNSDCTKFSANQSFSGYSPANTTNVSTANSNPNNVQPPATVYSMTDPDEQRRVYERVSGSWSSGTNTCIRRWRVATTDYTQNGRYGFTSWDYKPVNYSVSTYNSWTPVSAYTAASIPTGTVPASGSYNMVDLVNTSGSTVVGSSTAFDGCVEERDTVAQNTFPSIPTGAYDMDFVTVPSSTATKWRPMWSELIYDRGGQANVLNTQSSISPTGNFWCPAPASKLNVRTHANVQDYVNSLVPTGNTYHDLGMAWGARMLSPTGIWASENATAPNGKPISRHLIFMTDGTINTPFDTYSSHGFERSDRRVFGTGGSENKGNLDTIHTNRFIAMCNAARAQNMVIWTVAFGTSNPPSLVSCADPGKSYTATSSAQLQSQFQAIASQIAELRLAR